MKAGWQIKKLGEVCRIRTGKKDVNEGNPNGTYPFFTCAAVHTYSDSYSFDTEALLVAGNGDVGNVSYYSGKFEAYQRTYVLSEFYDVVPRFLYLILDGKLKASVSKQKLGNTMPYIKMGMLTDFLLPLPPLTEQQRIVAILDEAFESIATAKLSAEQNLKNARELFDSYLQSVFTQRGEGWVKKKLGEVCNFIGGSQPPKSNFLKEPHQDAIRFIQIRDYKSDDHIVYVPKRLAKRFCNEDDIMIGRYGPPVFQILRGLTGAYNVALMKAVPNENEITKDYLYYFLKHRDVQEYVIKLSSRAAGQSGLNKETIEPYCISYPALDQQVSIVRVIDALSAETQRLEAIYKQKIAVLDELKQSLLQKAFAGEL